MATSYLDQLWPASPAADIATDTLTYQEATAVEPANAPPEPADMPAPVTWDDDPAPTILNHALAMAARGFRVFPLRPGEKEPFKGFAWKTEATTDPATIRAWFTAHPAANYAVAAGDGLLIVDLDPRAGSDASLQSLPFTLPADTLTVRTPGGGRHVYLSGPDVANSVGRLGAGIDIRSAGGYVVGPGSFFADPGGKKGYSNPYVIERDASPATAPEGLVLACGTASARERDAAPVAEQDRPEDIERAARFLADAAPAVEGKGGDAHTFRLACELRDFGLTEGTALDMMAGEWNARCLPPWSPEELAAKVANAFSYGQNRPATRSTAAMAEGFGDAVTLDSTPAASPASAEQAVSASEGELAAAVDAVCDETTLAALLRMSPLLGPPILAGQPRTSPPWLVKKTIPRTGAGMIFGPSTGGKSYVVMDLAAKLWQGTPWFGAKVPERRATVIFAFEGGEFAGFRLDALEKMLGDKPGIVVIPAGRMTPAGLRSCIPQLRGIDKFCRARFGLAVGLVVIDTVSAAGLAEKEDKADDVAPALKAVQEFAGTVGAFGLLVHHPNKGGAEMRGSGAWFNNTDVVLKLDVDSGGTVRTLTAEKVKDGPSPRELGSFMLEPITLGRDEDGEPIEACVVRPTGKPAPQATAGVAHFDKFVRAFEDAADRRGASRSGRPIAPISEVNELFRDAVAPSYKAPSGVRMAWKRCIDFAERASIIRPVRGERNTYELTEAAYAAEDPNAVASERGGRPEDFTGATTF